MHQKEPNCHRNPRRRPADRPSRAVRTLTVAGTLVTSLLAATGTVSAAAGATHPIMLHPTGHTSARRTSDAVTAATEPRWIHIAAGWNFTCGIREGNTLWCWGDNANGALGTGT